MKFIRKFMPNKPLLFGLSLLIFLVACDSLPELSGTSTEATDTPSADVIEFKPIVSATGEVVPEQEAMLSVSAGGVVEEVLVNKGDEVTAGQVLVKLEGTEQQQAAISAAELELVNAKFALQTLYKDTNLLAAEALRSGRPSGGRRRCAAFVKRSRRSRRLGLPHPTILRILPSCHPRLRAWSLQCSLWWRQRCLEREAPRCRGRLLPWNMGRPPA